MINLKKILTIVFCIVLNLNMNATTPAQKLIKRLQKLQLKGIMIGHQDDPVYGHSWKWERGRSDIKEVCGDYPAVMGFDLGKKELGWDKNLDAVPFDRMREEIIAQYERGGIITLSWHPDNPVTLKTAWDFSGDAVKAVLPGGEQNNRFNCWLYNIASFIKSLKTAGGKSVPVIFRPWHEMGGGWFWWGAKAAEEYKQLFIYTHDQLEKKYHCNNIVWSYSPNGGCDDYMKYYPGDEYVDMLGIDIYEFDKDNAKYTELTKSSLAEISAIAEKHNKIMAYTETGCQQLPYSDWFTTVLWPAIEDFKMSYVLFWRNAWDQPKETYMASPGQPTEEDFKLLFNEKKSLFVNDIKDVK